MSRLGRVAVSEDAGSVLLSVNELAVCLDARTWLCFLNLSRAVHHRQLVNLRPVNNVLNPRVTRGWNPSAVKFQKHYRFNFLSLSLFIILILLPYSRFYLSIDGMSSQNWKGCGRKWSWPDLRLTLHFPGGTEEYDDNLSPNSRSLGC